MTFVKAHPGRQFSGLLDNILQDFPGYLGREVSQSLQGIPVNIVETEEGYHLELNAPGRNKEAFKIALENGLLTISSEKPEQSAQEGVKTIRKEFAQNSFKRSFTIDEKIDAENIQAKYENGLLKLFLPKKEVVKLQPKAISVQ